MPYNVSRLCTHAIADRSISGHQFDQIGTHAPPPPVLMLKFFMMIIVGFLCALIRHSTVEGSFRRMCATYRRVCCRYHT